MSQKVNENREIYRFEDISKSKKIFYAVINLIFFLIIVFTIDLISGRKLGLIKLTQIITLGSDEVDWKLTKESYNINNLNPLEKYISIHPTGKYIKTAKELLESLVWNKTVSIKSLEAYKKYVEKFPNGKNYTTAVDEIDWFNTITLSSINAYSQYKDKHPDGKYFKIASEEIEWDKTLKINAIDSFYLFFDKYSEGKYFNTAKDSIWSKTKVINSFFYYNLFAQKYPDDYRTKEAKERTEDFVWNVTQNTHTIISYEQYLKDFPVGRYRKEANESIENLIWEDVQKTNTPSSYKIYIEKYPYGKYIAKAQNEYSDLNKLELEWEKFKKDINSGKGVEVYNKPYPPELTNGTFSIMTKNKSTIDGVFSYHRNVQRRSLRADLCDVVITCSVSGLTEKIDFHGKLKDKPCSLRKRCGPVVFELNECDRSIIFRISQLDWP